MPDENKGFAETGVKNKDAYQLTKPLGLQLWTVRNHLEKDLPGTLQKVAGIGYNYIELFGYNGMFQGRSAAEFGAICADAGLTIVSSHYRTGRTDNAFGSLTNGWEKAIADAAALNIPYMVCAWLEPEERLHMDSYQELAEVLNKAGEMCRQYNIKLCYHGHDFEFFPLENEVPYEYILRQTNAQLVNMEADIYWMTKAGEDPLQWFERYPGRFPLWHVKDMDKMTGDFAEVGSGIIPFNELFSARYIAGLRHWFVEQDESKIDPMNSIEISKRYVLQKAWF